MNSAVLLIGISNHMTYNIAFNEKSEKEREKTKGFFTVPFFAYLMGL